MYSPKLAPVSEWEREGAHIDPQEVSAFRVGLQVKISHSTTPDDPTSDWTGGCAQWLSPECLPAHHFVARSSEDFISLKTQ
jgi:hypothetical protein